MSADTKMRAWDLMRFFQKVEAPACSRSGRDSCWEWSGSKMPTGYGSFYLDGASTTAHRAAYILCVGPIPSKHVVDHLCRNPGCVNPDHLEAVTNRENTLRGDAGDVHRSGRCRRGHRLTPDNVYVRPSQAHKPNRKYTWDCRECIRIRRRQGRARKRAAQLLGGQDD